MDPRILWAVIRSFFEPLLTAILLRLIGVETNTEKVAQENVPFTIEYNTAQTWLRAKDPVYGFEALKNAIDLIVPPSGPTIQDVLDAIAALPAGSALVIPSESDIASEVWNTQDPNSPSGKKYGDEQNQPYMLAIRDGNSQLITARGCPFFLAEANINYPSMVANLSSYPEPDWTDILAADTRLTWLTRTETYFAWDETAGTGSVHGYRAAHGANAVHWWFTLTEAAFQALKAQPTAGPPLWPGDALVVKGAPVELTASAIIEGPMDGILLTVDAVGPRVGNWAVLPFNSYYRAGYVLFLSPEGHAEAVQYIGPIDAVYCRQSMSLAASVVVKLNGASQVTVTPWTRL